MDHLRILSIIDFVFAALFGLITLAVGGFFLLSVVLTLMAGGGIGEVLFSLIFGVVFFVVFALFTGLYVMAGMRVRNGRGRILQTILAVLNITSIPIGTLFAGYSLWLCWMNEETKARFEAGV